MADTSQAEAHGQDVDGEGFLSLDPGSPPVCGLVRQPVGDRVRRERVVSQSRPHRHRGSDVNGDIQVRVDLVRKRATVQQVHRSFWSAFRISHTFSGSRYNNPGMTRDWLLTSVWVLAMDALAIGLLVMVVGSYYMWYRLKPKRTLGWIVLSAGFVTCGLFVFGLSWRG